ncbi:Hypp294 [Branchiostoma lanceolatum]|uniref:Hypp294 protein n=1 Tax=Branchiostoma lanceolatum TaxID=7740 RepID=A0A8J9V8I3_BRALA|nr:Hypp294 [Branchiostoma lanceolatum]
MASGIDRPVLVTSRRYAVEPAGQDRPSKAVAEDSGRCDVFGTHQGVIKDVLHPRHYVVSGCHFPDRESNCQKFLVPEQSDVGGWAANRCAFKVLQAPFDQAAAAATATYRVRPESTAVLINRTVSLRCAFDGLSGKDQVNWYWYNPRSAAKLYHISSGLNVAPEFPRYLIAGNQRKGEHHLKIQNALPEDEGNYRCSVFSVRDAGDAKLTVVGKYMFIPSMFI